MSKKIDITISLNGEEADLPLKKIESTKECGLANNIETTTTTVSRQKHNNYNELISLYKYEEEMNLKKMKICLFAGAFIVSIAMIAIYILVSLINKPVSIAVYFMNIITFGINVTPTICLDILKVIGIVLIIAIVSIIFIICNLNRDIEIKLTEKIIIKKP